MLLPVSRQNGPIHFKSGVANCLARFVGFDGRHCSSSNWLYSSAARLVNTIISRADRFFSINSFESSSKFNMNEVVWFLQQKTNVFQKLLVVWGKEAFDNVTNHKKNPLIKPKKIDTESDILQIIVFNNTTTTKKLPLTTVQYYGGEPVLVVDMSQVHFRTVMESCLMTGGIKHFYSLNLPFWSHQCVVLCKENVNQLCDPEIAYSVLDKITKTKSYCSGCFKILSAKRLSPLCGHDQCDECISCYHPDHKTEPDHIKYTFI